MKKIKWFSDDQKKVINFNKYLLHQFISKEASEITILALSKKVELSYRATYKRVQDLIKNKILVSEQDEDRRGKPVVLKLHPDYKSLIKNYLLLGGAKTPQEEKEERERFLADPKTLNVLKAIKKAGKPLNYSEIHEKAKIGDDVDNCLEELNRYELIDTRYHITRKGSAFVQKKKK